jgi:hypothetical protein
MKLSPDLQRQAQDVLAAMENFSTEEEKARKRKAIMYLVVLLLLLTVFTAVILFAPIWLKVLTVAYVGWRFYAFWQKRARQS